MNEQNLIERRPTGRITRCRFDHDDQESNMIMPMNPDRSWSAMDGRLRGGMIGPIGTRGRRALARRRVRGCHVHVHLRAANQQGADDAKDGEPFRLGLLALGNCRVGCGFVGAPGRASGGGSRRGKCQVQKQCGRQAEQKQEGATHRGFTSSRYHSSQYFAKGGQLLKTETGHIQK
jgi:hypothetical protein